MSAKKTNKGKSKKEEALAFLDDLDNFTPPTPPTTTTTTTTTTSNNPNPNTHPNTNITTTGGPASSTATPRASSSVDRPTPSTTLDAPRASTDSARRPATATTAETEDPNEALAFLEAQIAQKRPIRSVTPINNKSVPTGPILPNPVGSTRPSTDTPRSPSNIPTATPPPSTGGGGGGGWGTSFWSSASAAVAKARTVADEGYKMVKEQAEKVQENTVVLQGGGEGGGERGIGGINLGRLGIAEGLGQLSQLGAGVVRGVDLDKLRADILSRGQSAITDLINTVAPPISEHETLQVWLAHEMVGYDGVTGVVESGVARIMEQTSSEDLEVIFLPEPKQTDNTLKDDPTASKDVSKPPPPPPPPTTTTTTKTSPRSSLDPSSLLASATSLASQFQSVVYVEDDDERSIRPVHGWEEGWKKAEKGVDELVERVRVDSRRRGPDPSLPVTTIPIYIHIQPTLVPLPFSEPPISTAVQRESIVNSSTESTTRSLNVGGGGVGGGVASSSSSNNTSQPPPSSTSPPTTPPPTHLTFILSLVDPTHSLRFVTITQYSPSDWLNVEYDKSDWVEERLVGVLRTGIEGLLQEYVATRMGLKRPTYSPSNAILHTPTSTNRSSADGVVGGLESTE